MQSGIVLRLPHDHGANGYCSHHQAMWRSHTSTAQCCPVHSWTKSCLLGAASLGTLTPHQLWWQGPSWHRVWQRWLLSLPPPPSKYHPGQQNHHKRQHFTCSSHCSYMSIPYSRRTLGTIHPSQHQHFPGSHPVPISAKVRKPSAVGKNSSVQQWTPKDEVNHCPGVPTSLLSLQREPSSDTDSCLCTYSQMNHFGCISALWDEAQQ